MWFVMLAFADKPEGKLPVFEDLRPRISCCLSRDLVAAPIRDAREAIRACWTASKPKQPVRSHVRWTVTKEGEVSTVEVELGNKNLDQCLREIIEAFEYPSTPCDFTVTYPVHLVPG